jgi:hypothetical protein
LFALMTQLGLGASVPRIDPISGLVAICHTQDGSATDRVPSPAPGHPAGCPICPLCVALHAPPAMLASAQAITPPAGGWTVIRSELPPPATAPPALHRQPSQPRAPPIA